MKKQAGFTIVELVVVIALLGILAAVALPRFLDVTNDAHNASINGTAGALRSAAGLVKAQAVVDEIAGGGTVTYDGTDVTIGNERYPAATSAASCVTAWTSVLQAGAPVAATNGSGDYTASWVAAANGVPAYCQFTYNAITAGTHFITYTPSTGGVAVTAP